MLSHGNVVAKVQSRSYPNSGLCMRTFWVDRQKTRAGIALALVAACAMFAAAPAHGNPVYSFINITQNDAQDALIGEAQLSMGVSSVLGQPGQIMFSFLNTGLAYCSITDIYFDDSNLLAGIAQIYNVPGIKFSVGATPPVLPGGQDIGFEAVKSLSIDSANPPIANGVGPGELLEVLYNLQSGVTFDDVINALNLGASQGGVDGSLRVGIHVQGFENGGSEAFVNGSMIHAPVPAASMLSLIGLGIVFARKRY